MLVYVDRLNLCEIVFLICSNSLVWSTISDPRGSWGRTLGPDFDFNLVKLVWVDRSNLYALVWLIVLG